MKITLPNVIATGIYNSNLIFKKGTYSKNRKVKMFEIEIALEKGGISYVNEKKMKIEPDLLIIAKPNDIRHTLTPFKCYYVHMILLDGELYDKLLKVPTFIKTNKKDTFIELFKKISLMYEASTKNQEIMLQSHILELVYLILEESKNISLQESLNKNTYEVVNDVINYILNNLTSDLSLKAISKRFGFSSIYFHNFFKSSTGKTLHDFVEEQRLKKAINLLTSTSKTVTEIAYECGFSSQSYFNYVFKKAKNTTPKQYVKNFFNKYENID